MRCSNRKEAHQFYRDLLFTAKMENNLSYTMNVLGRRDLFYLLVFLLNRKDVDKDWLYDRCKEVQNDPDGHIDLWARDHYKSTIITFGKGIQDILDSHSKVIDPETGVSKSASFYWDRELTMLILSNTRGIAGAFLDQIKTEFEDNQLLKDLYPDVLYQNPKKEAPVWSSQRGITVKRTGNPKEQTVEAYGLVDSPPISKHFVLLNYEDVVTEESVNTGDQIKKTTKAFQLSDNLGSQGEEKIRIIGTRYHFNDTYGHILKEGLALPRVYACTENGQRGGEPVLLTHDILEKKFIKQGPYVFGCQMLQNPKADNLQGFQEDWFQFWHPKDWGLMNRYLLVDPANEKKEDSDYTVMLVVGLASDGNKYLIAGMRSRMNLADRWDNLSMMHRRYFPLATAYEKYGKDADIEHMESQMENENYRFHITPVGGTKLSKEDRIKRLVPDIFNGKFWFPIQHIYLDHEGTPKDLRVDLTDELISFPVSKYDDTMDCLARIYDIGAVFPKPIATIPIPKNVNTARREYEVI